jgi:acetyl-CoA synthetase
MRDGWLYTGDRFVRDSDGFHYFRGRTDDLIKVSGQWVYPLEVELCLANHPDVHECAVMGVELADRRMTLQAWVVPAIEIAAPEEKTRELQDYVKSRLLPYKYPRSVHFVATLPKTGTGKIDRQALLKGAKADGGG